MIIENLKAFDGVHCETTATGTLLRQLRIELSEPMLFGLGEGLGYIFWNMRSMDFPFIGGRVKPDQLTQNIARNLHLELVVKETSSAQKAWNDIKALIDDGQSVGLKLDCFYLDYFSQPIHFAGHYVAMYGYDNQSAYLVDTNQQGGLVKTSLKSLSLARAAKGPMASRNLHFTLHQSSRSPDLKQSVLQAIRSNATDYINPPITNIGYKGVAKTATEIVKWFKNSRNIADEFRTTAMLMEKAGTGGALFRNLFRDFLHESFELLKLDQLNEGYEAFAEIAGYWNEVSALFERAAETENFAYIQQSADILRTIAEKERKTMEMLAAL
jgi:hypothetical protein